MDVNNAVLIQCTQVDGLFGQAGDLTHLDIRATDQINVLQCPGTQFEQFQRQRVFFRFAFLCNIAQRLHGLQKAINGAFRHHHALRQLCDTNFTLFSERL